MPNANTLVDKNQTSKDPFTPKEVLSFKFLLLARHISKVLEALKSIGPQKYLKQDQIVAFLESTLLQLQAISKSLLQLGSPSEDYTNQDLAQYKISSSAIQTDV